MSHARADVHGCPFARVRVPWRVLRLLQSLWEARQKDLSGGRAGAAYPSGLRCARFSGLPAYRQAVRLYFVSDESERNPAYAAPIEAASGRKKTSIVRRQLQAGADFIGKTTTGHGRFQFRPVFAGRLQGEEMRTLLKTRSRIRFRGKKYAAKIISTGKIAGAFGQ